MKSYEIEGTEAALMKYIPTQLGSGFFLNSALVMFFILRAKKSWMTADSIGVVVSSRISIASGHFRLGYMLRMASMREIMRFLQF